MKTFIWQNRLAPAWELLLRQVGSLQLELAGGRTGSETNGQTASYEVVSIAKCRGAVCRRLRYGKLSNEVK